MRELDVVLKTRLLGRASFAGSYLARQHTEGTSGNAFQLSTREIRPSLGIS